MLPICWRSTPKIRVSSVLDGYSRNSVYSPESGNTLTLAKDRARARNWLGGEYEQEHRGRRSD